MFKLYSDSILKNHDTKKYYNHSTAISNLLLTGSIPEFVFSHGEKRYKSDDLIKDSLSNIAFRKNKNLNSLFLKQYYLNIFRDPIQYMFLVLYKSWKFFTFTVTGKFDLGIKVVQIPLLLFFILGFSNVIKFRKEFLILILPFLFFVVIHSLLISLVRYFMPVAPIFIIISAIGTDRLFMRHLKTNTIKK